MALVENSPADRRPASVVLGVGGGIAAYKACELLRRFSEAGHSVTVVPTAAALEFVGAATWAALSGHAVSTDVWSSVHEVPHVRIGQTADLVVVAPATADLMARAAAGLAGDLLTNVLLTARCPVLFAPAMHTEMWDHPATRANVELLRSRGSVVMDPASGRLTGRDTGPGRLPDAIDIWTNATALLELAGAGRPMPTRDLAGRHVVVSAGGTREPLDPVRFLGNRSTGLQGYALARAARLRGARTTLVSANVSLPAPAGVDVVPVGTALELRDAVRAAAADADVVVMAAAVADFRPAGRSAVKVKKTGAAAEGDAGPTIELTTNPDVLAGLAAQPRMREGQVVVGFAAETGDAHGSVLDHGRAKLARKGCDLLIVNEVGDTRGFGTPDNEVTILGADGSQTVVPNAGKDVVAHRIWDAAVPLLEVSPA